MSENYANKMERDYLSDVVREGVWKLMEDMPAEKVMDIMSHTVAMKKYGVGEEELIAHIFKDLYSGVVPSAGEASGFKDFAIAKHQKIAPVLLDENAMLSRKEAAAIIGRTENTVKNQVDHNKLVGYMSGANLHLPAWQFNDGKALNGLRDVLTVLGSNGLAAIRSFTTPLQALEGKTLLSLLKDGDLARAVEVAQRLK